MKKIICLIILNYLISSLLAQQDDCIDVLSIASKDIKTSYTKASVARYINEKYCEGKSMKSGISISANDEDLLSKVGFGFGSSKEKVSNICKDYTNTYNSLVEEDIRSSTVVREAIDAWIKCKKLANEGIKVVPSIQNTQFTIDVARGRSAISINGIKYDTQKCTCKALFTEGDQTVLKVVDESTFHKINDENYWNISCTRIPKNVAGVEQFDELDFSLSTSSGTYILTLPREMKPSYVWIDDVVKEIENLKTKNNNITNKLEIINNRFNNIKFERVCVKVEENCDGKKFAAIQAPSGYVFAFAETDHWPGGPCGQGKVCKVFIKVSN